MSGYKSALLAYVEEMRTTRYPREIEAELAVRAWALDDLS